MEGILRLIPAQLVTSLKENDPKIKMTSGSSSQGRTSGPSGPLLLPPLLLALTTDLQAFILSSVDPISSNPQGFAGIFLKDTAGNMTAIWLGLYL